MRGQFYLLIVAFLAFFPLPSYSAAEWTELELLQGLASEFGGAKLGGEAGVWCEFVVDESMGGADRVTIYTNGAVKGQLWGREGAEFHYETTLSSDETAYLAMILRFGNIIEKPAAGPYPGSTSRRFFLWLQEEGKTKLIDTDPPADDPDMFPVLLFFEKLVAQVRGMRYLEEGSVYSATSRSWLQPVKALQPLKHVLRETENWEAAALAFLAISKLLTPEQFAGYAEQTLREASPERRRMMFKALTSRAPLGPELDRKHASFLNYAIKTWSKDGVTTVP